MLPPVCRVTPLKFSTVQYCFEEGNWQLQTHRREDNFLAFGFPTRSRRYAHITMSRDTVASALFGRRWRFNRLVNALSIPEVCVLMICSNIKSIERMTDQPQHDPGLRPELVSADCTEQRISMPSACSVSEFSSWRRMTFSSRFMRSVRAATSRKRRVLGRPQRREEAQRRARP